MRVIDFFCGGGGFSEGFRQAGFNVIWSIDNWKVAVDTHNENHPEGTAICDDVIRISKLPDREFHDLVPDSEVIIGSPPCTFFSNSNRSGNGNKTEGKKLILAYLRIVARKMFKEGAVLRYWLLENVPKVSTHIQDSYTMKQLGLKGDQVLIVKGGNSGTYNAKHYGVPSNRLRYMCGHFPKPELVFHDDAELIPLSRILDALGEPMAKLDQHITDPIYGLTMPGSEVTDHHYVQRLSEFERTRIIQLKQDKGYMGRMAVPENPLRPARTIMATMSFTSRECFVLGTFEQLRAPSIREVATLMSFPIDYRFYGNSLGTKYRMVGNAVPPKMSYAFAKAMKQEQNEAVPETYVPIDHANTINFTNLNFSEIPVKVEKPKKSTARFKYHIPYFKFDTYRVELTNHHSDFEHAQFRWDAEIHYNQGKEKAEDYQPWLENMGLGIDDMQRADAFVERIQPYITSFNRFQEIYCMTAEQRKEQDLIGPLEVLNLLKEYLDQEFDFRSAKKLERILILEEPYIIPWPIAIGYYILDRFTQSMANDEGNPAPDQRPRQGQGRTALQA